jgi:hypothetical protein
MFYLFEGCFGFPPEEGGPAEHSRVYVQMPAQHQVFHSGHPGEKLDILEGAGDPFLRDLVRLETCYVFTVKDYFPGVWLIKAVDAIENCGLSGTVRADDGEDRPLCNRKADVIRSREPAEADGQACNDKELFFYLSFNSIHKGSIADSKIYEKQNVNAPLFIAGMKRYPLNW